MNFSEIISSILKNNSIVGAISSSVLIILFGFYLRKTNVLKDGTSKTLSDVILSASLPALAFNSFMQDINKNSLEQGINLLIWGFAIYILLIFLTKVLYIQYKGDKKSVLEVLTIFGSTTFFGIPIVMVNYTQSLFPAMLSSYIAAKLETFFRKVLPDVLKLMFAPFLTVLIATPLVFLLVGPVMTWLSDILAAAVMAIYHFNPILFGIIGGAFWQVIVVFGLHYAFIPVLINNITNLGHDPLNAVFQVTVMALAGAAIGYALKTKSTKQRTLGFSVGLTGLLGITEPIIYSIALPVRRQFIYAWISGGVAGAIMAATGSLIYNFGNGGVMAIPLFIAPDGKLSSMSAFIVASVVAFVGPIIMNFIFGTGEGK